MGLLGRAKEKRLAYKTRAAGRASTPNGGGGGGHGRRARGRAMGSGHQLADRRDPHGTAPRRQGHRVRLERGPARRGVPTTASPGPRSGIPASGVHEAGDADRLQHLLQRPRPSDGRDAVTAGGNKNANLDGIRQTHAFDYVTKTWSRGPDMVEERWYPTVTPLRERGDAYHRRDRRQGRCARGAQDRRDAYARSAPRRWTWRSIRGSTSRPTGEPSCRVPVRRCGTSIPRARGRGPRGRFA